ncbi:site-specific DNA-methyltransferase (cytosine-N4-specific) [Fictibacillus solisalsi]|uniref:site-specific DNA-methyltransferase (cytosine-N(4)-specific) n=1 Tax=Fictibacillus solisalsi TaxID=459525 RepID=A0A1H0BZP8_9BACL|nr:DNA methyltransferase [Fictibacillus solisalsi]SDN51151.1 site-specific DNA-methyltransferase (cytosine-N4-specific) [Fictibacillus solisalsi]
MQMIQKFKMDLDNILKTEKANLTHNFHPYPAKFIPQMPREIMNYLNITKGSKILDPFCGSGTTLVEACLLGIDSVGVDSNPIAILSSKVKSTPLNENQLSTLDSFLNSLMLQKANVDYEIADEKLNNFKNRDHWFERNMFIELMYIKGLISTLDDIQVKDFFRLALSSIVVKCSNQDSDTRWVARSKDLPNGYAFDSFIKKSNDMINRIKEFSNAQKGISQVFYGDSRNLSFLENNVIDHIITSPPYLNSFDYYLYHKLRMFILGYDHKEAQELEIGSRNKHNDKKHGMNTYFDSIKEVFTESYRVLKPNGICCVVIGDSIVKSELVEMDKEYRRVFEDIGYEYIECFSYNQRKYTNSFTKNLKTQYKNGHFIFFKK